MQRRAAARRSQGMGVGKAQALTAPQPEAAEAAPPETDAEELAGNTTECSNCGHPGSMHADTSEGDNMGACSAEDCSCGAMETASSSADLDDPDEPVAVDVAATLEAADEMLPAEMAPGAVVPERTPSPEAPVAEQPTRQREAQWTAVFAPEGRMTSDNRAFAPGAIRWRGLPLTLMGLTVTEPEGHEGAELCGRIEAIWRDENVPVPGTVNFIRAAGVFDTGDYGREIARLVGEKTLRGNSVDLAIHEFEYGPRSDWFDADGNWAPKPEAERSTGDPIELLFPDAGAEQEPMIYLITDAEIGMSTVCPFPAFEEGTIEIATSIAAAGSPAVWTMRMDAAWTVTFPPEPPAAPAAPPALTAAAAGLAPLEPPAAWFDDPQLDGPTPMTVDDDGRLYGHLAVWEIDGQPACHTAFPGVCVTPPTSPSDYAYFHLGEVVCDGGERLSVGKVTLDAPHAGLRMGRADATAHYDHTGTVAAHVRAGEDEHGIWVAGAVTPTLSEDDLRILRGAVLSGDWRDVNGRREMIAALCVNVPGFLVPRAPRALVASSDAGPRVLSLVSAGIVRKPTEALTEEALERLHLERLEELRQRVRGETASTPPSAEARLAALAERARAA